MAIEGVVSIFSSDLAECILTVLVEERDCLSRATMPEGVTTVSLGKELSWMVGIRVGLGVGVAIGVLVPTEVGVEAVTVLFLKKGNPEYQGFFPKKIAVVKKDVFTYDTM